MSRLLRLAVLLLVIAAVSSGSTAAAPSATVQLEVVVVGKGRVVSEPAGISCPGRCEARFPAGAFVELTPLVPSGSTFQSWRSDCPSQFSCLLRLQQSRRVVAVFRLAPAGPTTVTAKYPVTQLAADGNRVAFAACGQVFVWTPPARAMTRIDARRGVCPEQEGPYARVTGLAVAGDRVVYELYQSGNGAYWFLHGVKLGSPRTALALPSTSESCCVPGPFENILGYVQGAGSLLVFSSWDTVEVGSSPRRFAIKEQRIHRIEAGGCPCPVIETEPGPIIPFDISDGRVVAGGDNETLVLDANGTVLRAIPFSPKAGVMAGDDLALVRQGELRHYSANTGSLLRTWTLPNVPSGDSTCGAACRLTVLDAARGLVAYVFDARVHVLRLSDGADREIAGGSLARFTNQGLVYAAGPTIRLVPFGKLPIH